jgi:hypothetical protein
MRLYHYTALLYLPDIMREGLTRGEVPLDLRGVLTGTSPSHPNLTGSANPAGQDRARGSALDKTKVRITVDVPDGDPLLVRWLDLCRQHRTPRDLIRRLDRHGQGKFWWIYRGVIAPDWFDAVREVDLGAGQVRDDLQRAPLAGDGPGEDLFRGHAGHGGAQVVDPPFVGEDAFGRGERFVVPLHGRPGVAVLHPWLPSFMAARCSATNRRWLTACSSCRSVTSPISAWRAVHRLRTAGGEARL